MSIYVAPRPAPAKSFSGPGAMGMLTQRPLEVHSGPLAQQKLMYQAATFWRTDPWIRAAERVISGKFSTVDWHVEDGEDVEIDDKYEDTRYLAVRDLFERPQAEVTIGRQMTRRDLWSVTSRHMGACGNAFWYLDQQEPIGRTPASILYIAPWRMSAATDKAGNLTGWVLDYSEHSQTGTPLAKEDVLQFMLEPPDEGQFGVGLVESALSFATLDKLTIGHAGSVLTSGGRLAGIVSPKSDAIPDDKFAQLVRDFRTISELPDNAKRVNILQNPIQFDRTAATPLELSLLDLMKEVRDDILALWGVPISQLGGTSPAGMNSGDIRKYDEAALWQNAVHPRLVPFGETVQYQLLDRWKAFGMDVELEIDEPEFDDDGPRYELLQKSQYVGMRESERRALIGLEPFGDPILDNAVYMPNTLVQVATAPDLDGNPVVPEAVAGVETSSTEQPIPEGAGDLLPSAPVPAKASGLITSLKALRARVEKAQTPSLIEDLRAFLDRQKREIASRLRANAHHTRPLAKDTAVWFPASRFDRELRSVLERPLTAMAQNVSTHIETVLPRKPSKASVAAVDRALTRGAARVTGINQTTKDRIAAVIAQGIADGLSVPEVADLIEADSIFDEARAELIARTELMDAYNGAALGSYSDAGVVEVQAIDGDGDEECAARDGQTFSVDEADSIEDHPNGTLDWIPVIE